MKKTKLVEYVQKKMKTIYAISDILERFEETEQQKMVSDEKQKALETCFCGKRNKEPIPRNIHRE